MPIDSAYPISSLNAELHYCGNLRVAGSVTLLTYNGN